MKESRYPSTIVMISPINSPSTPSTVSSIAPVMKKMAMRLFSGRGGVIPKVMMKASVNVSSSFIVSF